MDQIMREASVGRFDNENKADFTLSTILNKEEIENKIKTMELEDNEIVEIVVEIKIKKKEKKLIKQLGWIPKDVKYP